MIDVLFHILMRVVGNPIDLFRGWLISPQVWIKVALTTGIAWILSAAFSMLSLSTFARGHPETTLSIGIIGTLISLSIYCSLLWLLVTRRWRYSLNERGRYLGWTIGQAALLVIRGSSTLLGLQMIQSLPHNDALVWLMFAFLCDLVAIFLLTINTIAIPSRNLSESA